jgi:ketosteroid isomerase-like protein
MRAGVAALALATPAAYAWAVRKMFRHNIERVNAGDPEPLFKTYAEDIRFVFPGESTWAGDYRGRDEVMGFVQRFVDVGLQMDPHEILVSGPPWNTRVCLRYTGSFTTASGERVYENTGVIFARIAWGKLKYYEVNEDTEKVAEFDVWLATHEPPGA